MAEMNFKQYLNKINKGEEPETLEQQEVKATEPPTPTPAPQAAPVEPSNPVGDLLARYFAKANGDAIIAFDGFASDLRTGLSDFLQNKWVPIDYFKGQDDKLAAFQNTMHQLLDVKNLPKLQEFLHSLGVTMQNAKNNAK